MEKKPLALAIAGDMSQKDNAEMIDSLTEEQLHIVAQTAVNWMSGSEPLVDEDGFLTNPNSGIARDVRNHMELRKACWDKFVENPQINSHVRDFMGSLTGNGFETESPIEELQDKIDEILN